MGMIQVQKSLIQASTSRHDQPSEFVVITRTLRLIKQPRLNLVVVTVCYPKCWGGCGGCVQFVQVACSRKLASNWNKMAHLVHVATTKAPWSHFFCEIFGWMHEASVGPILPLASLNMSIIHIIVNFIKTSKYI